MSLAAGAPGVNNLMDFSNDAPDTATRTIANFLLEITFATSATTTYLFYLYWGNASATNGDASIRRR